MGVGGGGGGRGVVKAITRTASAVKNIRFICKGYQTSVEAT
jgi:hypothetical protein